VNQQVGIAGRHEMFGAAGRDINLNATAGFDGWCRLERPEFEAIVSSEVNGVSRDQDHLGIARRLKCWF
jgi:hypothetical protein